MIQRLNVRLEQRDELTRIVNARLKHEMKGQLEGMGQVDEARQSLLMYLELHAEAWVKDGTFIASTMQTLMERLDGLRGVWNSEIDLKNTVVSEFTCGCAAAYFSDLAGADIEFPFDRTDPRVSQTSTVRAWTGGDIVTIPNYAADPELADVLPIAHKHGIRSSAAVPVPGRDGHPAFVITLFGQYPCRFESWPMQLWLRSLQQFLQRHFAHGTRTGASAPLISKAAGERYRRLLHDGGLRMHVQPIVDLSTGQLVKVEALARLQDDAELIAPARFLPAYGERDLAFLFHQGLVQGLSWLRQWDEAGLPLDLSLNLPPSVLTMPDCAAWVQHELEVAEIAPHRLYLELLDSDDGVDQPKRDLAIAVLGKIGVRLVMDDLGAGYSSLLHFQTMPFMAVKIDRSPVQHVLKSPEKSVSVLGALVRIVHGMGMRVVMEGLETTDLVEMAAAFGADWGQGYAISKAIAPETLLAWASAQMWAIDPEHPVHALGRRARAFNQEFLLTDWKNAVETHQRWRLDFERRLQGGGKPLDWQSVCRDDKCPLGQWLYRHQRVCAAEQRPLFEQIMAEHAAFHQMAGSLVRRAQEGGDVSAALAELSGGDIATQSSHLVALLDQFRETLTIRSRLDEPVMPAVSHRSLACH